MKKYIWGIRRWIFSRLFFNFLYIIIIAGIPYILKFAIDYDYSGKGVSAVLGFVGIYLAAALLGMLFQYFSQISSWKLDQKFYLLIKNDLFRAIIVQKNSDFKKKAVAEYVSVLNNDVPLLAEYIQNWIVLVEGITKIIVYAVYLLALDYRVAIVIMVSSALSLLLPNVTAKKLSRRRTRLQDSIGQYMEKTTDLMEGFCDVNKETKDNFSKEHQESLTALEDARIHYGKYRAFSIVLNGVCMYLLDIAAFAAVVFSLLLKTITVGTATGLLSYIKEFTWPIREVIDAISEINSAKGIGDKILEMLSYEAPELEEKKSFDEAITFHDVSIGWEHFHMEHFTYSFEKGKKYAIIGQSGSGKSTLFQLLLQREVPDNGTITIDGEEIAKIDYTPIMCALNQKEHIFKGSFHENVTVFGSYRKKDVQDIVRFLNMPRVNMLSKKADCSSFSGGEKNLLSAVKSFVMDKDIVLLDEPFAALDVQSKGSLERSMLQSNDKTMLVISHDISEEFLRYFDEILILNNGKLVASGEWEKVLQSEAYLSMKM